MLNIYDKNTLYLFILVFIQASENYKNQLRMTIEISSLFDCKSTIFLE